MAKRTPSALLAAVAGGSVLALLAGTGLYIAEAPKVILLSGMGLGFGLGATVELVSVRATWANVVAGLLAVLLVGWVATLWPDWGRFLSGAARYDATIGATTEQPTPGPRGGIRSGGAERPDHDRPRPLVQLSPEPVSREPAEPADAVGDGATVEPGSAAGYAATAEPASTAGDGATVEPTDPRGAENVGPDGAEPSPSRLHSDAETGEAAAGREDGPAVANLRSLTVRNGLASAVEVMLRGPGADADPILLGPGHEVELDLGPVDPGLATLVWRQGGVEERVPWTAAAATGAVFVIRR